MQINHLAGWNWKFDQLAEELSVEIGTLTLLLKHVGSFEQSREGEFLKKTAFKLYDLVSTTRGKCRGEELNKDHFFKLLAMSW